MTPLTCESCDPLLVDLALDELDEATALAVRQHADDCDACSRALARLTMGRRAARELVLVDAPDLSAVLVAARARAAEVHAARVSEPGGAAAVAPVDAAPPEPPRGSWLDEALRFLGGWAARPQVAMGTLFVLMVGIGLWYVPQFRWRSAADPEGVMVEPDTSAELGPSTALEPAAPLALGVDPHTRRVELEPDRDVRPTTEIATAEETEASPPTPPTRVRPPTQVAPSADDGVEQLAVTDVVAGEALGRVEEGPLPDLREGTSETAIALEATSPPPPADYDYGDSYRTTAPATTVPRAPTATTPSPVAPTTPSTPRSSVRPDTEAEAPSAPSAAALLPNAIHRQARSLASAGHCAEAVPRYEALLRDHGDYADAPRAMLELGECQRRLGRLDAAGAWISRAERFPSVSSDARRARVRLETEAAASERASETAPSTAAEH